MMLASVNSSVTSKNMYQKRHPLLRALPCDSLRPCMLPCAFLPEDLFKIFIKAECTLCQPSLMPCSQSHVINIEDYSKLRRERV